MIEIQLKYQCVNSLSVSALRLRNWIQVIIMKSYRELKLTNPMDVVLTVVGIVIVDDKLDIIHVQTTGGNIGGDEDAGGAVLEFTEDPVPLLLLLVAVDTHSWPSVFPHQP